MENRTGRAAAPRLNAIASCVLAAFGVAIAGSTGSFAQAAAPLARSNHGAGSEPVSAPDHRRANRMPFRNTSAVSAQPTRPAGSVIVANCDDSGPGSLRQAMLDAVDGDTIDMSSLACSTITLSSGRLVTAASINLQGPGRDLLAIDGNASDLVIRHEGAELGISNLTITNGSYVGGYGGCVWAGGNLTVVESAVTGCVAGDGNNSAAYGAGLDVIGDLMLQASTVSGNTAHAANSAYGGGVYAGGMVYAVAGSVVSGNVATGVAEQARGGGIFARGNAVAYLQSVVADNRAESTDGTAYGGGIQSHAGVAAAVLFSTISGNTAHSETKWSYGGGLHTGNNADGTGDVMLIASTVSGNSSTANCQYCYIQGGGAHAFGNVTAKYSTIRDNTVVSGAGTDGIARGGGVASAASDADGQIGLLESTISGNSAVGGSGPSGVGYGGGVASLNSTVYSINSTIAFNSASTAAGGVAASNYASIGTGESAMASTIISNNEAPEGADIDLLPFDSGSLVVIGDHNLVTAASVNVTLPGDTLSADPQLLPLSNNGGPTATHALVACSPAIDSGSNPSGLGVDQRQEPYVREWGAAADIGAFELQPDADRVFADGFDPAPCP